VSQEDSEGKHPQFREMTIRKTGPASKVLELQSFYKGWVNSVFAPKSFFMSCSALVVKHHRGFALKLSQQSCLPHGTESHYAKKEAYILKGLVKNFTN
jgi:hypothetical protein